VEVHERSGQDDGCKSCRLGGHDEMCQEHDTHNLKPAFFSSALEALAGIQALALELLGLNFMIHTWKSR
jgi:hypothetical protein